MKAACFITFSHVDEGIMAQLSLLGQIGSPFDSLTLFLDQKWEGRFPDSIHLQNLQFFPLSSSSPNNEDMAKLFSLADQQGLDELITLPLDLGFTAKDLTLLLSALTTEISPEEHTVPIPLSETIVIGVRPNAKDGIRRSLLNFAIRTESGIHCQDSLSSLRSYPVPLLMQLFSQCHSHTWENELLARALRAGFAIKEVSLAGNHYAPAPASLLQEIQLLLFHSWLIFLTLCLIKGKKLTSHIRPKNSWTLLRILRHPVQFLLFLLTENSSPTLLGYSAAVGSFIAILPIPGLHVLGVLYAAMRLKLNKVMALTIQNLYCPPFSPILCIEIGHYLRYGEFYAWPASWQEWKTCFLQLHHLFYEWFLGSLIFAPIASVIVGFIIYLIALIFQGRRSRTAAENTTQE